MEKTDRFSFKYSIMCAVAGAFIWFSHAIDRAYNLYILLDLLIIVLSVFFGIYIFYAFIINLLRRNFRLMSSAIAAPFLAYALFFSLTAMNINQDRILFFFQKGRFVALVEQAKALNPESELLVFPLGDTGGAAVVNIFDLIVYDESGEIKLPKAQRSRAWMVRAQGKCPGSIMCAILEDQAIGQELQGSFYLVRLVYG